MFILDNSEIFDDNEHIKSFIPKVEQHDQADRGIVIYGYFCIPFYSFSDIISPAANYIYPDVFDVFPFQLDHENPAPQLAAFSYYHLSVYDAFDRRLVDMGWTGNY